MQSCEYHVLDYSFVEDLYCCTARASANARGQTDRIHPFDVSH